MTWLSPYLYTSHQAYGAVQLELTHGEPLDFTLLPTVQDNSGRWHIVDLGQFTDDSGQVYWCKSRWTNLCRKFRIVLEAIPDAEILAEVALGTVRHAEATLRRPITRIRFTQLPTPSYEEYAAVADQGPAALREVIQPQVVYEARVIREQDRIIGILPTAEPTRTAPPAEEKTGA